MSPISEMTMYNPDPARRPYGLPPELRLNPAYRGFAPESRLDPAWGALPPDVSQVPNPALAPLGDLPSGPPVSLVPLAGGPSGPPVSLVPLAGGPAGGPASQAPVPTAAQPQGGGLLNQIVSMMSHPGVQGLMGALSTMGQVPGWAGGRYTVGAGLQQGLKSMMGAQEVQAKRTQEEARRKYMEAIEQQGMRRAQIEGYQTPEQREASRTRFGKVAETNERLKDTLELVDPNSATYAKDVRETYGDLSKMDQKIQQMNLMAQHRDLLLQYRDKTQEALQQYREQKNQTAALKAETDLRKLQATIQNQHSKMLQAQIELMTGVRKTYVQAVEKAISYDFQLQAEQDPEIKAAKIWEIKKRIGTAMGMDEDPDTGQPFRAGATELGPNATAEDFERVLREEMELPPVPAKK